MDQDLRELERQAAKGDPHALYRLLIRRYSLGDFELADLSEAARKAMAVALMQTLEEPEQIEVLSLASPDFYPNHTSVFVCPNNPSCAATPDEFTYHHLAWENHNCFVDEEGDPPTVDHQSNWESVLDTHLHCPQCQSTWRITDSLEWN